MNSSFPRKKKNEAISGRRKSMYKNLRRQEQSRDLAALVHRRCLARFLARLLNDWSTQELSGLNLRGV